MENGLSDDVGVEFFSSSCLFQDLSQLYILRFPLFNMGKNYLSSQNMSNFVQEFEEDEQLQSTIISQSSNGSPSHVENCGAGGGSMPSTTSSKKKRNLPGNPGSSMLHLLFNHSSYPF